MVLQILVTVPLHPRHPRSKETRTPVQVVDAAICDALRYLGGVEGEGVRTREVALGDPTLRAKVEALRDEMQTMRLVAGQAALDARDTLEAMADNRFAAIVGDWSDRLLALLDTAPPHQEQCGSDQFGKLHRFRSQALGEVCYCGESKLAYVNGCGIVPVENDPPSAGSGPASPLRQHEEEDEKKVARMDTMGNSTDSRTASDKTVIRAQIKAAYFAGFAVGRTGRTDAVAEAWEHSRTRYRFDYGDPQGADHD